MPWAFLPDPDPEEPVEPDDSPPSSPPQAERASTQALARAGAVYLRCFTVVLLEDGAPGDAGDVVMRW
jgi:hypothetical protein